MIWNGTQKNFEEEQRISNSQKEDVESDNLAGKEKQNVSFPCTPVKHAPQKNTTECFVFGGSSLQTRCSNQISFLRFTSLLSRRANSPIRRLSSATWKASLIANILNL
ncbi:hypothetical protein CDAR_442211 [Caerostris darwini]|uniref:Uncharacterized protein n=1 Tax=Caerostris darwini TaxID=1538125 RepID=A0AAV4V0I4_9ARAC|nr:hypothetical protein CDAR_442211 [Caerostris darwini]